MKGKIDKHGNLWIERKGEWIKQQCMITKKFYPSLLHPSKTMAICCNHMCPLFGEPSPIISYEGGFGEKAEEISGFRLQLCQRGLIFTDLIDERGGE